MTASRSRKESNHYKKTMKTSGAACPFCAIKKGDRDYLEETSGFYVISNLFPYSLWDNQTVTDHLMITPKKHTDNLGSLTLKQKGEFVDLVSKYEADGYNVYARAPVSKIKTVVHQHTHLIKTNNQRLRFLLFFQKPYWRVVVK